jgi:hypothetical protein
MSGIVGSIKIPRMARVAQVFQDTGIGDIPGAIMGQFNKKDISGSIKPGMSVAITAGSRGIANIDVILKEVVAQVKKLGGKPFIFPAMGSHGGATAEGQRSLLGTLNVTEEFVGAPIRSSMETVVIGHTPEGKSVYIDKNAAGADGIIVVARIKPHTAFRGKHESGLLKMMVIGMGKQTGAQSCHDEGFGMMAHNVGLYAGIIMANAKILFGVALVENAFDTTCHIEAVPVKNFKERDAALLKKAKGWMPKIYIRNFDVLIVDQIGKNFSGDGADPNITGTYYTSYASGGPEFQKYVILDISDESHGNAIGFGVADFSTKRAFDKLDFDATYPNAITSTDVSSIRVPMIMKNDKMAIQGAIFCCTNIDKSKPKIVRIKNTSHIEEILISEALLEEAGRHPDMKVLEGPQELVFDPEGNLPVGGNE